MDIYYYITNLFDNVPFRPDAVYFAVTNLFLVGMALLKNHCKSYYKSIGMEYKTFILRFGIYFRTFLQIMQLERFL